MTNTRTLIACILAVAAICTSSAPLQAAQECEDPSYVPPIGQCAHLATADLYYRESGASEHGRRPTVILLHATTKGST